MYMYEEIAVMENVSEDEDRAIKEDGAEVAEEGIIHA